MPIERPQVTLHFAQSLDGRIGFPLGQRLQLSSGQGTYRAHLARSTHDAVLVGIRTVLSDDPRLSVRHLSGPQPRRFVLDSSLRLPLSARLLSSPGGPVTVFAVDTGSRVVERARALEEQGAMVEFVHADANGRVCLLSALALMARSGVAKLLVEGGALTLTSFLKQRLADQVSIELVPYLVGEPALGALGQLSERTHVAAQVAGKPTQVSLPELALPCLQAAEMQDLHGSWLIHGRVGYGEVG